MLLVYSTDKRHYAYDGPKISCTETYARCYIDIESMAFTHTAVKPVPEFSICGDKQTCRKDVQCPKRNCAGATWARERLP